MSLYLDQIHQLVELQYVDDQIHDVKKELSAAPLEVEELNARYMDAQNKLARIEDKLQHMKEQQKRLDIDLEDENSRLKKSKSKLMQVSNNKEFQAMAREMDNMERNTRNHEEERITLREEIANQEEAYREIQTTCDELRIDLSAKEANLMTRLEKANEELSKLETLRKETGYDVPEPVLARYEFIRRRLEHPVIVPVKESICRGCHIAIPPQTYIELQRGQQIWSCPNCQRLIYWTEHFHDVHQDEKKPLKVEQVFAEDLNLGESL